MSICRLIELRLHTAPLPNTRALYEQLCRLSIQTPGHDQPLTSAETEIGSHANNEYTPQTSHPVPLAAGTQPSTDFLESPHPGLVGSVDTGFDWQTLPHASVSSGQSGPIVMTDGFPWNLDMQDGPVHLNSGPIPIAPEEPMNVPENPQPFSSFLHTNENSVLLEPVTIFWLRGLVESMGYDLVPRNVRGTENA